MRDGQIACSDNEPTTEGEFRDSTMFRGSSRFAYTGLSSAVKRDIVVDRLIVQR